MAEQNAQAANLELARTAGSRYLVQRWGDGTICDKTNAPREVEVQVSYIIYLYNIICADQRIYLILCRLLVHLTFPFLLAVPLFLLFSQ